MVLDLYERVRVFRTVTGEGEVLVADFRTRIATGSRTITGRDNPSVQGPSSPQYSVMLAPSGADLKADDEAWSNTARFRIVSVDRMPHGLQVLLLNLQ